LHVESSRETAFAALESHFVNLIILDLRIPTFDGALDASAEHGHAFFARARTVASGTPVFVLTGSPVEDFIPAMLRQQQQVDIWGEGKRIGTVDFLQKITFEECPRSWLQLQLRCMRCRMSSLTEAVSVLPFKRIA
jgi:CheY-like chemotaxis protein